jgi:cyclopropane-fatty-acyl-phospholipid synthase
VYDAIVSVGAFEHFARSTQTASEKVEAYRQFFRWCASPLRPGGRLALQTIAKTNKKLTRLAIENARFIWEHIFPDSEVPRLSELAKATEGTFDILSLRDDREHYARTVVAWRDRLHAGRPDIVQLVGSQVFETYDRYLAAMESQFSNGYLSLLRLTLERV